MSLFFASGDKLSSVEEVSGKINTILFIYSDTGHPRYLPNIFILEFKRLHLESRTYEEKERETEAENIAIADVYLLSYLSRFIISHCRRSRRIVDAREGPRRISKTVSDRICIENAGCIRLQALLIAVSHCSREIAGPDLPISRITNSFKQRVRSNPKMSIRKYMS